VRQNAPRPCRPPGPTAPGSRPFLTGAPGPRRNLHRKKLYRNKNDQKRLDSDESVLETRPQIASVGDFLVDSSVSGCCSWSVLASFVRDRARHAQLVDVCAFRPPPLHALVRSRVDVPALHQLRQALSRVERETRRPTGTDEPARPGRRTPTRGEPGNVGAPPRPLTRVVRKDRRVCPDKLRPGPDSPVSVPVPGPIAPAPVLRVARL
jgi:hypothetical protein